MKFTDLFVKRPVLAVVVNLVILIAGLQSIRALSVRQYPRSDIAIVRVTTEAWVVLFARGAGYGARFPRRPRTCGVTAL